MLRRGTRASIATLGRNQMTGTQIKIAIIVVLLGLSVVWVVFGLGLPKTYRERKCAGNEWRSQFPGTQKEDIQEFLSIFAKAFAIREKDKLKFRPGDKLLEIRDRLNPVKGIDALELETLATLLKNQYGVELEKIWSPELTLGTLLYVVAQQHAPGDAPNDGAPLS